MLRGARLPAQGERLSGIEIAGLAINCMHLKGKPRPLLKPKSLNGNAAPPS